MASIGSTGPAAWLWERMARHLDCPALETEWGVLTYLQLLDAAERVAGRVRPKVDPGRTVLVLAPHAVPDTLVLLLGLWRCGLTVVLTDTGARELLDGLRPAAVVRPRGAGEVAARDDLDTGELLWQLEPRTPSSGFSYGCPDPACIIATAGSTGTPRLVLFRHSALRSMTDALADQYSSRVIRPTSEAVSSYETITALVAPLAAGSTLVFQGAD